MNQKQLNELAILEQSEQIKELKQAVKFLLSRIPDQERIIFMRNDPLIKRIMKEEKK